MSEGLEHGLKTLEFNVAGETFRVRTDLEESKLNGIAEYVEGKFKLHVPPGSRGDNRKRIILATMEIAGELLEAKSRLEELERLQEEIQARTREMMDTISLVETEV